MDAIIGFSTPVRVFLYGQLRPLESIHDHVDPPQRRPRPSPVSRSQLYDMIAEGKFPSQIHLGGGASFWVEAEIKQWIREHIAAERAAA